MFDASKSLCFRMDNREGRVCKLRNRESSFRGSHLNIIVGAWTWILFVGEFGLYKIGWFGSHTVAVVTLLVFVVFVLSLL